MKICRNLYAVLKQSQREFDEIKEIRRIRFMRKTKAKSIISVLVYRAITGARLKKVNQIIHIQIQQGQLLPRGGINASSIEWKPIDEFSIMSSNVKNGVDYHKLTWEKRALDLDDLVPAEDHLLTGMTMTGQFELKNIYVDRKLN